VEVLRSGQTGMDAGAVTEGMDMYAVNKIQVGCQAVIAGKPAPTVDRVWPQEMGWLSGRHRGDAMPGVDGGLSAS